MNQNKTGPIKKGIILAGGSGKRLMPMTCAINKHLLPIYDKPMIYYPLTTLMLAGIQEILIITTPDAINQFRNFLNDGSNLGLKITYAEQPKPGGLPEAFIIGEDFIAEEPVALILGDNFFYGQGLSAALERGVIAGTGAVIYTYQVSDPHRYGLLYRDPDGKPKELVEKPPDPKSNYAVTGLYFYRGRVSTIAKSLKPSIRNELEITDLNRIFLESGDFHAEHLNRGFVWFDTGTPSALQQASIYVEIVQNRQNIGISFPEEVAFQMGNISLNDLRGQVQKMHDGHYRGYLKKVIDLHSRRPYNEDSEN